MSEDKKRETPEKSGIGKGSVVNELVMHNWGYYAFLARNINEAGMISSEQKQAAMSINRKERELGASKHRKPWA